MREHTRLVDYFPVLMAVPPIAAFLCFALFRMSEKAAFGLTFIPMAIIITAVLLVVVHVAIVIYWLHRTGDPTGASGLFISVGGLLFHLVELGTTQAWAIDMKGLAAGPGGIGDVALALARYAYPIAMPVGGMLVSFHLRGKNQTERQHNFYQQTDSAIERQPYDFYGKTDRANVVDKKYWCHCDQKYRRGVCRRCG